MFRTKDNKFVYCALREVIKSALKKTEELGIDISQIIHKVLLQNVEILKVTFGFRLTDRQANFGILEWCLPTGSW